MSKIFTIGMAVVAGLIVADILIHPQGTAAAGTAANQVLVPTEASLLGAVPNYSSKAA